MGGQFRQYVRRGTPAAWRCASVTSRTHGTPRGTPRADASNGPVTQTESHPAPVLDRGEMACEIRRSTKRVGATLLQVLAVAGLCPGDCRARATTNIVYILADDLGESSATPTSRRARGMGAGGAPVVPARRASALCAPSALQCFVVLARVESCSARCSATCVPAPSRH